MHFLYQEKFPYFWLMQSLIRFFPEEPKKISFQNAFRHRSHEHSLLLNILEMSPFSHIFHEHSLYVKCFWRGFPFSHIFSLYWKHVAFWIRWWLWGNKSTNNPLPDEPDISDQKLGEIPFYICWWYYMNGPSFAEPLLTDPILNGEKWDFLVPRQAAGLVL